MTTNRLSQRKWDVLDDVAEVVGPSRAAKVHKDKVVASSNPLAKMAFAILISSFPQAVPDLVYSTSPKETVETLRTPRMDRRGRGSPEKRQELSPGISTARLAGLSVLFKPTADEDDGPPVFMD